MITFLMSDGPWMSATFRATPGRIVSNASCRIVHDSDASKPWNSSPTLMVRFAENVRFTVRTLIDVAYSNSISSGVFATSSAIWCGPPRVR